MKLQNLLFNYSIGEHKFTSMDYKFGILSFGADSDNLTISTDIKETFGKLESLLDEELRGEDVSDFIKKKNGKLSTYFTYFGYNYSGSRILKSWLKKFVTFNHSFNASLDCQLYAPCGKVQQVEIEISHQDVSEALLNLYNKILKIDGLKLSPDAVYAAGKINSLRQNREFSDNPLKFLS